MSKNTDRAKLRSVTPEEWVTRINKLPSLIRDQVANIIWWDHFADREVGKRWHHLDHIIRKRVAVTASDADLYAALIRCGYTPRLANIRLNRTVNGDK